MSSLLPPNATDQERALEGATVRIGDVPVPIRDLWNPQACPEALLPWLAWALSVDNWDASWPAQIKRDVIAESLELHRHKGTPWAVERALIVAGSPNARVEEWFEYGGQPGYFKVVVDVEGEGVSGALEAKLLKTIERFKNCRSWLDLLEYNLSAIGNVPAYAIGLQSAEVVTVYPDGEPYGGSQAPDGAILDGGGNWLVDGDGNYPVGG